jgi:diaminopimelate epimerase
MGPAVFTGSSSARLGGATYRGVGISMGNPHLVCAVEGPIADLDLTVAPEFDEALFPAGVNVEFVNPAPAPRGADLGVRMRVYERGVGETRSCGTGAVAVGVAALQAAGHATGQVAVDVPGGRVVVGRTAATTTLAGPAVIVASGSLDAGWLAEAVARQGVPA